MKILAVSRSFLPTIGGLETAADALTRAWAQAGHEVTIATQTPGDSGVEHDLAVLRRPSPAVLLAATRAADIVWHNHLSMRAAWPLALAPRPWVVTHQTWLRGGDGKLTPSFRIKRLVARAARSVAISRAIAADLPTPAVIIPNPYRDELFRDLKRPRSFELAFVGRFVSDKGAALLIDAVARLKSAGMRPRLLMIGDGPERENLRDQAQRLELASQVEFAGPRRDEALVEALNSASILVVPSLFNEPFGIVALEGIACGCAVIASRGGGLPDAVGPCGLTFANGDLAALTNCIAELLTQPQRRRQLLTGAVEHLAGFTAARVAARYLDLFRSVVKGSRS
jgi:glycosyltransferase involved in cell wall biosynthesis